jgi:hypothetical protein
LGVLAWICAAAATLALAAVVDAWGARSLTVATCPKHVDLGVRDDDFGVENDTTAPSWDTGEVHSVRRDGAKPVGAGSAGGRSWFR